MKAHNLPLVHALVGVAWAHDEAQLQTKNPKVIARLQSTAREADECARIAEQNENLSEHQQKMVSKLLSVITV